MGSFYSDLGSFYSDLGSFHSDLGRNRFRPGQFLFRPEAGIFQPRESYSYLPPTWVGIDSYLSRDFPGPENPIPTYLLPG